MQSWSGRILVTVCVAAFTGCGSDSPNPAEPDLATTAPVHTSLTLAANLDVQRAELTALGLAEIQFGSSVAETDALDASRGPAAKAVAPSPLPLSRDTPLTLLDGALDALAREDAAALARLSRAGALDEDDAAKARRRFLAPAGRRYWGRVAEALREGRYEITLEDDGAVVRVDVGGAAGSYRLRLKKETDGWYLTS